MYHSKLVGYQSPLLKIHIFFRMSCVRDLIERNKKFAQKEVKEGQEQDFIEDEVREGNADEGDEVVLENTCKGDIEYEDLGQSPG